MLVPFSCGTRNNVRITGEIEGGANQTVVLEQLNVDRATAVDSSKSDKNGRFTFKLAVEQPTFYNIKVGSDEAVTVIAGPDERIGISGSLNGLSDNYMVNGSENSLLIKSLNYRLRNTRTALDSLRKLYLSLSDGTESDAQRTELSASWDSVISSQVNFTKDFIIRHAISPASYYALYQRYSDNEFVLNPVSDLHSYKVVATSLKAMYPESQYTKAILKHLDQINKDIRSENLRMLIANSENSLPEIRLPDTEGDTIALSSLKGKYIILDFTVLGLEWSKEYIQGMKDVYDKFHNKGVRIYQVCLDENLLLWKNLVAQNRIDWICVRDGEAMQSRAARLWNIQSIPANYIINPKYEIVGKNLTGRRLEERLNDLLK